MSGGHYNYLYYQIADMYEGHMKDPEMNELITDLCDVLKALEWCDSGDTGEEDYIKSVVTFKEKWFKTPSDERVSRYIIDGLNTLKKRVFEYQPQLKAEPKGEQYLEEIKEIVNYLNLKTGANYRWATDKTQRAIRARINEGYIVENFKFVIDKKYAEWHGTDMAKYLCPDTLFGTKFEKYFNQVGGRRTSKPISVVDKWGGI